MNRSIRIAWRLAITALVSVPGCWSPGERGPYSTPTESTRNPLEAQRLTQLAIATIDSDPSRAESLLRDALTADLWHGPAHNNLGVLYLKQEKLYEAANEFEWAKKLMPGDPDPRFNLALTLEHARRFDEALSDYQEAIEQNPHHMPTKQALTRLLRWLGKSDPDIEMQLRDIALSGESAAWRSWARDQLVALKR